MPARAAAEARMAKERNWASPAVSSRELWVCDAPVAASRCGARLQECRRSTRGGGVAAAREVRKDFADHGALGDRRDDANATAAQITFLKIDGEGALEELLPAHGGRRRRGVVRGVLLCFFSVGSDADAPGAIFGV